MEETTGDIAPLPRQNIIPINIEDEMRGAYIDYSMSVIVSRALPDVRDGLKPVHRRVLYAMSELGVGYNKAYKKSARIVGECLGKYHPHGDGSVYDAMVRMAQDWSLRYPLVDGQGNFGSLDGDSPAAMRYTEVRFKRLAEELLADLQKETVAFQPNFDDSLEEPTVMPAKFPNLLVNGTSGIAVGMATNMAPHNLGEVVDGIIAYIDNNDITPTELGQHIKGPDFPTGGTIYGYQGIRNSLETGRGRIVIRANANIEPMANGREKIVFIDVPYMVNKSTLIEKIGQMVNDKILEGISDIRDESDRDGVRIVFDLKKEANSTIVLNTLYKYTALQSTFSINNVALVKGRPYTLTIKDLIRHFVEHRHEIIVKRTEFDLREARKRAHILEGLLIALDNLDEVISLIRNSADPDEARIGLITRFNLSEIQAKAILEMRLQRLTGLEREKLQEEYREVMAVIADLEDILANLERRKQIIKDELLDIKARYADERRTQIVPASDDISIEELIDDEDMVITISHAGYIKRTALAEYRTQGRGGVGSKATATKEDDFTEHLFIASMHNYLLVFMESGRMFWHKVYGLPEGSKTSKGRPIQNLIQVDKTDKVRAVLNVKGFKDPDYVSNHFIMMCTQNGTIKKTSLEAFSRPRTSGIIAININEGDKLLDVRLTTGDSYIMIAKKSGKAVRFHESQIRPMGRGAAGVRGITLEGDNDRAIGMVCVEGMDHGRDLLVLSSKGYGKRSNILDYRETKRGAKGVRTLNVTEKTGDLVAIVDVGDNSEIMIINKSGISIRMGMETLRVMGRNTQGVRLIRINDRDSISSVAKIDIEPEIADEVIGEAPAIDPNLIISADSQDVVEDAVDLDEDDEVIADDETSEEDADSEDNETSKE